MARAGVGLRLLSLLSVLLSLGLFSCGLVDKDVDVAQDFQAGGGAPSDPKVDVAAPLVASQGDLAHLSAVTIRAARIDATDNLDVSFISGATLTLRGNHLPDRQIAILPSPSNTTRADLVVDSSRDLRPYLLAGSLLTAKLTYSPTPASARGLRLTITVRGSL